MIVKLNRDIGRTVLVPEASVSVKEMLRHIKSFQDESHDILDKFSEIHPWLAARF